MTFFFPTGVWLVPAPDDDDSRFLPALVWNEWAGKQGRTLSAAPVKVQKVDDSE